MSSRAPALSRRARAIRLAWTTTALMGSALLATQPHGATPRFYPDDPIQIDNDRLLDAGGAKVVEGSNGYDFIEHTFLKEGDRRDIRAVNVSSVDEVPDSSWFTNRIGHRPMSLDEIVRGPNALDTIDVDGWPIVQEKSSGITPGYRIVDPTGRLYQIKFDPPEHPEMGTGAEVIGAAIYHALGYNVVQGYVVEIDPEQIVISPEATTVDLSGRDRELRQEDVDRILDQAARLSNGKYRAIASRFADGRPLGFFKYFGTRPDDPNDIHPHEHRRELRASRVVAAWLNHDDSRGLNSLDMLEGPPGQQYIRHFMFDFGSTLGSGSTIAQVPRAGNEYILEWTPALKTLFSLGLWVRPWVKVNYPEVPPSVGRLEADFFDPAEWRPEYPNPAFDNMRADDAFWAARRVANFTDEIVRAVVAKAEYTDPAATEHISQTLIQRRDKVLSTWLTGVNPIVNPSLNADGTLAFENAAEAAGVANLASSYELTWSAFDNATGENVGQEETVESSAPMSRAPTDILSNRTFVSLSIRTTHPDFPAWRNPTLVHFRRTPDGWETVGIDRSTGPSVP